MTTLPPPVATPPRLPRLATFGSHLLLDGHGRAAQSSSERRDMHPYLGKWPYNVGDEFVAIAIARLLRFTEFYAIEPQAADADFDRMNEECDVFVIRGSNFIYPGFFAKCLSMELLRKIHIPIVYIGAGVQFSFGQEPRLLDDDIASLKYIHDSCASCSVRGFRSAEILNKAGIKNVRALGCPTILWSQAPEIRVRVPTWERVGWTMTDMTYDPPLKARQYELMESLRRRAGHLTVLAQGGEIVLQEYIFCRDGLVTENATRTEISPELAYITRRLKSLDALRAEVRYYYRDAAKDLVEAIVDSAFFSNRIPDYLRLLRTMSFVCGTRLHGNMMALSQGIPTMYVIHDQRLEDMVELLQTPKLDITQGRADFNMQALNWRGFEKAYARIYRETQAFLEENGLAHNLTAAPVPETPCQA